MTEPALPAEFLELLESVEAKRPRTVIDHILAHGYVTTEDLKERYGYNHPPRAGAGCSRAWHSIGDLPHDRRRWPQHRRVSVRGSSASPDAAACW